MGATSLRQLSGAPLKALWAWGGKPELIDGPTCNGAPGQVSGRLWPGTSARGGAVARTPQAVRRAIPVRRRPVSVGREACNSGSASRLVPGLRRATGGHRPAISSRSPTWQRPGRDARWPARRGCGPRPLQCSGRGHQGQQENAPAAAWSRVRSHLPGVPCPESAVVRCGAIIQSGHSRSFPDQSGTCFLATGCSRAACELILLLNVHGAASSAVHGQVLQGSYTAR